MASPCGYHSIIEFAVKGSAMKLSQIRYAPFGVLPVLLSAHMAIAANQSAGPISVGGSPVTDLVSVAPVLNNSRSFTDTISFSLSSDLSSLTFFVSGFEKLNNKQGEWGGYSFDTLTGSGSGFTVTAGTNGLTFTSTGALAAGNYAITLQGTADKTPNLYQDMFRYDVSYTAVAVSPVPEPETYALMLVGLGVIGYAARRRTRAAAPSSAAVPA